MALDLTKPNASAPAVPAQQKTGLAAIIKSKIANTLSGKKGEQFVADVVALVRNNPALATCDQVSLVASCLQAQTLGLHRTHLGHHRAPGWAPCAMHLLLLL